MNDAKLDRIYDWIHQNKVQIRNDQNNQASGLKTHQVIDILYNSLRFSNDGSRYTMRTTLPLEIYLFFLHLLYKQATIKIYHIKSSSECVPQMKE